MKICVTGSAGFIGYHLVNKLEELGHKVVPIDNLYHICSAPDIKFIFGDVRYRRCIEDLMKDCDRVYHLAAQISVDESIKNPEETIDINIIGTKNVLEICKDYKIPMVFASTSEVYGTSQQLGMDEKHPLDCQSPYGASKVAGDRLCKAYHDTYGMDVRILRNFNTCGPYQNEYSAVIAIFIDRALKGLPLYVYGDGEQKRDYMHVFDAVNAYLTISEKGYPGMVMNAGYGMTITINKIAEKVIKYTGSKSEIIHTNPRPGEVQRLCSDSSLARSLGWEPKMKIDEIIKEAIEVRKGNVRPVQADSLCFYEINER